MQVRSKTISYSVNKVKKRRKYENNLLTDYKTTEKQLADNPNDDVK